LTRAWSDRTRGNGFKFKKGRFKSDIRKKFFNVRVVRPWPRLPRGAVAAPSLAVLKARLDGPLGNLVWWKGSLPMQGGWNKMVCKVHSVILRWASQPLGLCSCPLTNPAAHLSTALGLASPPWRDA